MKGTDEERVHEAYQDKEDHFGEGKAFCGIIILQISAGAFEVKTCFAQMIGQFQLRELTPPEKPFRFVFTMIC